MEHLRSMMESSPGYKGLADEMRELGRLRTAVMMEKCRSRNEVVACPKPRRRNAGIGEHDDMISADISEMLTSKASPPYFVGSPPIRCGNPIAQDSHFREQRASALPIFSVVAKGCDSSCPDHMHRSILTRA